MNPHYEKGLILFNQGRHEEAAGEFRKSIGEEPGNPFQHGFLALCLARIGRHQLALQEAKEAIAISPSLAYGHFILASVCIERNELAQARAAIESAIQIEPDDSAHWGALAKVEYGSERWAKALEAADKGLSLDPTDEVCAHYRSLALSMLGRSEEAEEAVSEMLRENPNDSHNHDVRGWLFLQTNQPEEAKTHFLEALRLDPGNSSAREGLANALKARHFIFGWALQVLLYADRFQTWAIWIFCIGIFGVIRFADAAVQRHAEAYMAFWIFKALFWSFLILIVVAHPLFDVILRLDREGRRVLTPDQRRASNWYIACFVVALAMGLYWSGRGGSQMGSLAMATLMLTHGIRAAFLSSTQWVRRRMFAVVFLAAALIPLSVILLIIALVVLIKFRTNTTWLVYAALAGLPMGSLLLSAYSQEILEYFERRRPDDAHNQGGYE